jgi:uncharacterized protein GlcG (DUF336 family)
MDSALSHPIDHFSVEGGRMRRLSRLGVVLAVAGVSLAVLLGMRRSAAAAPDGLSQADLDVIVAQAIAGASLTNSGFRTLPAVQKTKMQIAVVARDGKLLRLYSMPDAWVGSIDIAIAKGRTAAFFSSNQNALTSRIVGAVSQPGGPLWGIGNSNQIGISGSQEYRNGIITFPGGVPLYKNGQLVGGIGVSGDGVDQDEAVAFAGAAGFEPGAGVAKLGY